MVGLYEKLLTALFRQKIQADTTNQYTYLDRPLEVDEAAHRLAVYVAGLLEKRLAEYLKTHPDVAEAVRLVNEIITQLPQALPTGQNDLLDVEARVLTAVLDHSSTAQGLYSQSVDRLIPTTGLAGSHLFSGSTRGPSLASELAREILSADRIDWLVSFVRQSGVKPLWASLQEATQRGTPFRLLTTTYMAVSDFQAINRIARLPNTEVRISYNENATRLHAKAYLFYRNTGSHTVYVGSSNLSSVAMDTGLEWNVKASMAEVPQLVQSCFAEFDEYWNDSQLFEPYDPRSEADQSRLQLALKRPAYDAAHDESANTDGLPAAPFELFDYQEEVLKKIDEQRTVHHSMRNLVVAATGTGKTVMVANDFKRYREQHPEATFLFIVHREEIIRQARETFRRVLSDENFGEMWFSGIEPQHYKAVFASVATLQSRLRDHLETGSVLPFGPESFDYIVLDEAHHMGAQGYLKVFSFFHPKVLVGLTATPERLDKYDIKQHFDDRFAAEIRLNKAINDGMLVPFTYYGLPDVVDLTKTAWRDGRYVESELSAAFIKSAERTARVLGAVRDKVPRFDEAKTLAFCVDKAHAKAMAEAFKPYYRVDVLTSDNTRAERDEIIRQFKAGQLCCLFVVDIFNEGVDIPDVDTVLFLRPTQSLTVFLQQLGRGLRRAKDKVRLTVLDFISRTRPEFDWTIRFGALFDGEAMGLSSNVANAIFSNAMPLPKDCQIFLEEKARETVLANIRDHMQYLSRTVKPARLLLDYETLPSLSEFLFDQSITLEQLYKKTTWRALKSKFESRRQEKPELEEAVNQRIRKMIYNRWLQMDDRAYIDFLIDVVKQGFDLNITRLTSREVGYLMMLYFDYFEKIGSVTSLDVMMAEFQKAPDVQEELREVLPLIRDRMSDAPHEDTSALKDLTPLQLYGRYTRAQIMAALGRWTFTQMPDVQSGVSAGEIMDEKRERSLPYMLLFVTVDKGDKATADYLDYAIDETQFHWQSPNATHPHGRVGQALLDSDRVKLLFVRRATNDESNRAQAYYYLGAVTEVSHHGSKPMSFVWRLATPMPAHIYVLSQRHDVLS